MMTDRANNAAPAWLRRGAVRVFRQIARSRWSARFLFRLLPALGKRLPDDLRKQRVLNALKEVPWPELQIQSQRVQVGTQATFKIIPHIGEFDFKSLLFRQLGYEAELYRFLDEHINKYDIVFDIGANVGIFSLYAAWHMGRKGGVVHAFEASEEAFRRLLENIRLNAFNSLSAYNVALSDQTYFVDFYEPEGHLTNGSLDAEFAELFDRYPKKKTVLAVHGGLLKGLIEPGTRVLMKVDTEGAEAAILSSLKPLLRKHRIDLIVEVLPSYVSQLNELDFLLDGSYALRHIKSSGVDGRERFEAGEGRDYFLESARR